MTIYFSVAEPKPVELQLLWGSEAGTGAVISYFGSGSGAEIIFFS